MHERIRSGDDLGMVDGGRFRLRTLEAIQDGEPYVYSILTRQGAIKFGFTHNLAVRKRGIKLGGTSRILAFRPGDLALERDIHQSLTEHRIYGYREYYYPTKPVIAKANWILSYWGGLKPINRHYIPRLADCTFHREVQDREAADRRRAAEIA